ncbi:MAG: GtrA family protein [Candidatus Harrisonbacteria bacterium]|nr:GtrA family protein [Candidatus Harrisonbacteria bacterium]
MKKDFQISVLVGFMAGVLLLPTLRNLGVQFNLSSVAISIVGLTVLTPAGYAAAYWLSQWWPVMLQFIKFAIVGGLNFTIDLAVLNFLIFLSGISVGYFYTAFKATSFVLAVINSYFWNKYWTFHVEGAPQAVEFTKFIAVNLIGFGINVSVASAVVNLVGAPPGISETIWANVGAVTASVTALFWNFIGMKFVVFKR